MLEKIEDFFPACQKIELSDNSVVDPSSFKEKTLDKSDGEGFQGRRKLSHSEFYERSPTSKKSNKDEEEEESLLFKSATRAKSEEGDPMVENLDDLEMFMKEYTAR